MDPHPTPCRTACLQDELLQPGSHVHACLDHLPALQESMDLEPPDVGVQSSKLRQVRLQGGCWGRGAAAACAPPHTWVFRAEAARPSPHTHVF